MISFLSSKITTRILLLISVSFALSSMPAFAQQSSRTRVQPAPLVSAQETQIQQQIDQHQYAQAINTIDALLKQTPRSANLRFLKGVALSQLGQTKEAQTIFLTLTQEFPELAHPYNNLAVIYMQEGNYQEAKSALEMAVKINPSYTIALENLGDVYLVLAQLHYQQAKVQAPNNATSTAKQQALEALLIQHRIQPPAKLDPVILAQLKKEIDQTLQQWAQAWSLRDATKYLGFYADNFILPKDTTREQWAADRKLKLEDKKQIRVELHDISIEVNPDTKIATIHLTQHYFSDQLNNVSHKTLQLQKINGSWLITQEKLGL